MDIRKEVHESLMTIINSRYSGDHLKTPADGIAFLCGVMDTLVSCINAVGDKKDKDTALFMLRPLKGTLDAVYKSIHHNDEAAEHRQ